MARNQRGNPIMTVRLPPKVVEQLKAIAEETGTSVSELVRLGVETIIAAFGPSKNA